MTSRPNKQKPRIRKNSLRVLFITTVIVILIGTVFYHAVEDLKWLDAVYFSVITLTTVGYGDITPQTDAGKLFTIIYIITGIGIIFAFINALYDIRSKRYGGTPGDSNRF